MNAYSPADNLQYGRIHYRATSSSTGSTGRYEPSRDDFIKSFYAVLERWMWETAFLSDPAAIKAHPSYAALLEHVDLAAPLIFSELAKEPSQLVWVLNDAYPVRPFANADQGNITAMSRAWVDYGKQNGRHR